MNKQAQQQLAAIRERLRGTVGDIRLTWADVTLMLNLLADAERERDAHKQIAEQAEMTMVSAIGEKDDCETLNYELAEDNARLRKELATATERAEQAADARQAEIVAWLKQCADDQEDRGDDIAIRMAAVSIERGELREKGGGDG